MYTWSRCGACGNGSDGSVVFLMRGSYFGRAVEVLVGHVVMVQMEVLYLCCRGSYLSRAIDELSTKWCFVIAWWSWMGLTIL